MCSFEPFPGTSAVAVRIGTYLPAFASHFSVVVITAQSAGLTLPVEKISGARILRVSMALPDLRGRIEAFERAVRRQIESEQPAVVYLLDPFAGYSVFQQKPRFGFKVIFDGQTLASEALLAKRKDLTPQSDAAEKILKRERFCLNHADRVMALQAHASHLLDLGAKPDRLVVQNEAWSPEAFHGLCVGLAGVSKPTSPVPPAAWPLEQSAQPRPTENHPQTQTSPEPDITQKVVMPANGLPDPSTTDASTEVTLTDLVVPPELLEDKAPGLNAAPTTLHSPADTLDPWLEHFLHGYCPPEDIEFARPTPATNFPGRQNPPESNRKPE